MERVRLGSLISMLALLALACRADDPDATDSTSTSETGTSSGATSDTTSEGTSETTGGAEIPEDAVWLELELDAAIAEVDPRYLSYTLDTSKVVSSAFDFDRPRLQALTAELSPALLRVGGTNADGVYYDMSDTPDAMAPEGYAEVMGQTQWDPICAFASDLGVEMMFTLNAGPGPRDVDGAWTDDQARELIEYSVANDCPVGAWELGNEVGLFAAGIQLSAEDYADDFVTFTGLLDEVDPGALAAGPASAYLPIEGEVVVDIIPGLLAAVGELVDIVTWHYYPMQSLSCGFGTRLVVDKMPIEWLETVEIWSSEIEGLRDADAPGAAIWLGETGHAQCGGEPDISNTFASSFWWLDQLGRLARRGQPLVARQALVANGAYRLIEDTELAPTPDYYASVLWKRHMGTQVLDATLVDGPDSLLAYAHCDLDGPPGGVSIVALNYDEDTPRSLVVLDADTVFESVLVTADNLTATELLVNDGVWEADADGQVPVTPAEAGLGVLELPPLSYAFIRVPDAGAPACQ